jgi:hypothetical protein
MREVSVKNPAFSPTKAREASMRIAAETTQQRFLTRAKPQFTVTV